jgi:hypothetical protein
VLSNNLTATMKQLLSFVSCFFITITVFSQIDSVSLKSFKIKKGFYFSFDQIAKETPGRIDSFVIQQRTSSNIRLLGGGKYIFDLASKDKNEFKEMRKNLVGLSDGENFYISDKFTVGGWQGLTPCFLSGPYVIADIRANAGQYSGGGFIPSLIKVSDGYLIDLKSGHSIQITKKSLRDLLVKYPDIQKKYEDKENILIFSTQIVEEINAIEKRGLNQ